MRLLRASCACVLTCVLALGVTTAGATADPAITSLLITPGQTPNAQYVDGSTVWVRPETTGSFTVEITATSHEPDGVTHVEFPPIATGWEPQDQLDLYAPPYRQTYVWTALSVDPGGDSTVVAWDDVPSSDNATFRVRMDGDAPTGSELSAQSVSTRDTAAPVGVVVGDDAGSGIGGWQLRRRTSSFSEGACGAWSPWGDIGPDSPPGHISDALGGEGCYQYSAVVRDNVGNIETIEQDGELRVDRTAPLATIDAIPASAVHGSGTVELVGDAIDAGSGVRSVSVTLVDRYSICSTASVDAGGRWHCTWSIDYAERVGSATVKVGVVDLAGNRTWVTQGVMIQATPSPFGPRDDEIDRTPPIVGLARMPFVSWKDTVRVKPTARDDRGGYVDVRVQQQTARANAISFGPWQTVSPEAWSIVLEERGETTCFRAVATDNVGNVATSYPRCTTLPFDDTDLPRRGRWDELDSRQAWLGTLTRASRRGSSMTIRTADTTPQVVVATCPQCGSFRAYHGRRLLGTYSTHARRGAYRRIITLAPLLNPRSAAVRIVSTSNAPLLIDGFVSSR